MSCRSARARLHAAVDQRLALEARLELEAHLADCKSCARLAERLAELDAALVQLPAPPELDLEAQVRAVRAKIEQAARPAPRWRTWMPRIAIGVAAAAAAVIVIALLHHPSEPPAPPVVQSEPPQPPPIVREPAVAELAVVPEPPTPAELERLAQARLDLAAALSAACEDVDAQGRAALAARFSERTRELERAGWPIERLAEGLVESESPEVACAALRYLGLRGERAHVRTLQRALDRTALRPSAALALADLGTPALDAIVELLRAQDLIDPVLARLAEDRDEAGARLIETIARRLARSGARESKGELESRRELTQRVLATLQAQGAPAVPALLRLAADESVPQADILARLNTTPEARSELERILRTTPRAHPSGLLIAAVERLHPEGGAAWLAARVTEEREQREAALTALISWNDVDALRALIGLHVAGRISLDQLHLPLESTLESAPAAVASLVAERAQARDRTATQLLYELLAVQPRASAVPALIELSKSDLLSRGDRKTALLEVGENGAAGVLGDAELLAALYPEIEAAERELRAACLWSLHRLGGDEALARLFTRGPARALERLRALLDDPAAPAHPTTTLIRIAQELDTLGSRAAP